MARTSFLDSRIRLRNRANRLLANGMSVSDNQLNAVAHVGRPGGPTSVDTTDRDRQDDDAA
ncbi:MAG: hypothetical protein AAGK21_04315 [Bacteroidota bacterium]